MASQGFSGANKGPQGKVDTLILYAVVLLIIVS